MTPLPFLSRLFQRQTHQIRFKFHSQLTFILRIRTVGVLCNLAQDLRSLHSWFLSLFPSLALTLPCLCLPPFSLFFLSIFSRPILRPFILAIYSVCYANWIVSIFVFDLKSFSFAWLGPSLSLSLQRWSKPNNSEKLFPTHYFGYRSMSIAIQPKTMLLKYVHKQTCLGQNRRIRFKCL